MSKPQLVHNYCQAVERDPRAHPIQPARDLLPPGVFHTAADLYNYTVCPFGVDGRALAPQADVAEVESIIFDNVYARTGRHVHPANADWAAARSESFVPSGGFRDQAFADELRARAVQRWGDPSSATGLTRDRTAVAVSPRRVRPAPPFAEAPAPAQPGAEQGVSLVKILDGCDEHGEDMYYVFEVDRAAGTMALVKAYDWATEADAFKDGYNWSIHRGRMLAMRREFAAGIHAEFTGDGPGAGFEFDFDMLFGADGGPAPGDDGAAIG
ncbi:MAG: hypothetical protein ACR2HN_05335 [Tepidiformaceae bacterium]